MAKGGRQQKQKKLQKATEASVAMDAAVRWAEEERQMAEHYYTSVTPKRKPVSHKSGIGICPKCRKNEPGGAVQSTPHFRVATSATPCDYHHCGLCPPGMAFWSVDRQDLMDHKKEQHPFICGKCQIGFLSQDELTRHHYAKHNPLHYCMPCERVYTSIQGYRSHETTEMHRGKEAVDVLTELGLEQLVKKRRVPWEARGVPDALKTQNAFEQGCFVVHNLPKMKKLGEKIKQGLLAFPTPAASVASEDVQIEDSASALRLPVLLEHTGLPQSPVRVSTCLLCFPARGLWLTSCWTMATNRRSLRSPACRPRALRNRTTRSCRPTVT